MKAIHFGDSGVAASLLTIMNRPCSENFILIVPSVAYSTDFTVFSSCTPSSRRTRPVTPLVCSLVWTVSRSLSALSRRRN